MLLYVINPLNHENGIRCDHDIEQEDEEHFTSTGEGETWFGIIPFMGVIWEF